MRPPSRDPRVIENSKRRMKMKRTVIVFGLIAGVIIGALVVLMRVIDTTLEQISLDHSQFIGYGIMVVSLSMIFFGIKSYRDTYGGGKINFWKGVQIGLLITAIAAIMYAGVWLVHNAIFPEWLGAFMERYSEYQADSMRSAGSSQAEIDTAKREMLEMGKMLENPLIFFLIALVEIIPVGIVITLISAAILRKKEVLPAEV